MNQIHKTAIVDKNVIFGKYNQILPNTILIGPLEIGDDNIIGPNVVIGSPGADTRRPKYDSSHSQIIIGSKNIIREFSSIQKPCYTEITKIGDNNYIMPNTHVQHDVIIENHTVITASVTMAGLVQILENAYLGMGTTIRQYCVIGQYSFVAMGASVVKNIKPFTKYIPNKPIQVNVYAIEKYGFIDFLDEIEAYVLYNQSPYSTKIKNIVDHFEISCSLYKQKK